MAQGAVPVAWLVERVTESTYAGLREAIVRLQKTEDHARKKELLKILHAARNRLLRLLAMLRWSVQVHLGHHNYGRPATLSCPWELK